jgi:tetratricopeptide (TPR) repeat protein
LTVSQLNEDAIRMFDDGRLDDASRLFCLALQHLPGGPTAAAAASGGGGDDSSSMIIENTGSSSSLLVAKAHATTTTTTSITGRRRHSHSHSHRHHQYQRPQQHQQQYVFSRKEYDEGMDVFSDCVHVDAASLLVRSITDQDALDDLAAILLFNNGVTQIACAKRTNSTVGSSSSSHLATTMSISLAMECFLQAVHVTRFSPCSSISKVPSSTSSSSSGQQQHVTIASLHNIGYIQFMYHGDILQAIATFYEALQEYHFSTGGYHHYSDHQENESSSLILCSPDNRHQLLHLAATLNCLGVLYYHLPRCETTRALDYLQQSLSIQRHCAATATVEQQQQHVMLATTLNNIGRFLYMNGKFDQAMVAYREALDIRRAALGNMHLDVAATIYNIGQTHHQNGNLREALEHYHEFMLIIVPQLGHCHRDVATILKCMAQIHQDGKHYQQALSLFHQALSAARGAAAALGGGGIAMHANVLVASICNKIGNLYYEMSDYRNAITFYQQGLEIERVVLDAHHPNIMVTLSNIGQIYKECGDLNAAALVYQQVLDLQLQQQQQQQQQQTTTLALSAPRNNSEACLAITYSNLGLIHYQNRNHLAALEMYQEALRIRRQVYGDDEENLEVAATLNSIGLVLFKLGLFELAIQSFSEGLRMRRKTLGDAHRDVAIILYNIATVHLELGAEDEAMDCYQDALQVEIKALGPDHYDLTLTLRHISQVYQQRGEMAEAMDTCLEILRIQNVNMRLPESQHHHHNNVASDMVQTYNCLANLCLQTGNGAGVVEALSEATRIARRAGLTVGGDDQHIRLVGFHLYAISKRHPEAAATA